MAGQRSHRALDGVLKQLLEEIVDNKVYVVRCPEYSQAESKTVELLDLMGGMNRFAERGEKILLKVNLLREGTPDEAVTTHPAVVEAVARMVKETGAQPIIYDSPGAGYRFTEKILAKTYETTGMLQAADESGAELNFDTSFQVVSAPEGKLIKRFEIAGPVIRADGLLNLCKLKTHSFTYMTGAVKNHFGVIPGRYKPGYHEKLRDTGRFANMLLDLIDLISSRVSIMDAVVAMEGDGPSDGNPKHVGLLLAATNPLSLDIVVGEMIGLPRENNPLLVEAENRGIEPNRLSQVELIGADISELTIPDFKLPHTIYYGTGFAGHLSWWQRALQPVFKNSLTLKPRISKKECVACAACYEACPVGAITMVKNRKKTSAEINDDQCIRCYCCHEMCADHAVLLKPSVLYRFANR